MLASFAAVAVGALVAGSAPAGERTVAPAERRIGAPGAHGLQRSPDGSSVGWLEPARGEGAGLDLVEYRAVTGAVRRIHVRAAERWWLGPGGSGAWQSAGAVTVWSAEGEPSSTSLRPPVEVVAAERPGRFRLVLRETAPARGGTVLALRGDGRIVRLARGATAVAVARSGNAIAIAGCDGIADDVCVWRGDALQPARARAADVTTIALDSSGMHLAIRSGAAGKLLLAAGGEPLRVLDERSDALAWSEDAPLLVWRSRDERGAAEGVRAWSPSTGVVRLACGGAPAGVESALASPDGKTVACLERAAGRRAGTLWLGPAGGGRAFGQVNDAVIAYGFSPRGDVLWMRHTCARDEEGCALAAVPVAAGAAAGGPTRLSGIGRRLRFDERRSDRVLFDADLDGWELVLREDGRSERLGRDLDWTDVALVPAGVVLLRKGANGGVFLRETGRRN